MVSIKPVVDTVVNVVAAISAPVFVALADAHIISGQLSFDLAAIVGAGVAAYHGGTYTERQHAAARPVVNAVITTPPAPPNT